MKTPTAFELERFLAHAYDPAKAHEYYEKHKKLKGRDPTKGDDAAAKRSRGKKGPITGRAPVAQGAQTQQRTELTKAISKLEGQLKKLDALIKKRESDEAPKHPKLEAKKERAAKAKDKPKTAAVKAKQELKHAKRPVEKHTVEELKSLATRAQGQLAVAKQKLAAL